MTSPIINCAIECIKSHMNNNNNVRDIVLNVAKLFRTTKAKKLRSSCQTLQERNCNEDLGEKRLQELQNRKISEFKNLFGSYDDKLVELFGDPRGFVAYLRDEELTQDEKDTLERNGVKRDWGRNYAIGDLKF